MRANVSYRQHLPGFFADNSRAWISLKGGAMVGTGATSPQGVS